MEQSPLSEDTSNVDTASPPMRQNRKDTCNRNEKGYSSGADLREHMAQWNRIKSSEIYSTFRKILARVMDISRVTSVLSDSATLRTAARQFLCPRDSPGKNTGVGCHALLQGMLQTQAGTELMSHVSCLLHWQTDSLPLTPPGKPSGCITHNRIGIENHKKKLPLSVDNIARMEQTG